MSAVLRFKRKACDEPVEGLVVFAKKSKCDETSNTNEVYFKFAATLKNETESIKDHLQAALSKDKSSIFTKWRDSNPKSRVANRKNAQQVCEKVKTELKVANVKKKLDLLNNRRLIFYDTFPIEEEGENPLGESAEVRDMFQLYDIIEENEETKKQVEEKESTITCNDELLIREASSDYVYDVYVADVLIDKSFVENTVSVRPCKDDDIYSGDSDDSAEAYEDEDDSNDENNWRNEYPEDEDSRSSHESQLGEDELYDAFNIVLRRSHNHSNTSDDGEDSDDPSRILKDLDADSDDNGEMTD